MIDPCQPPHDLDGASVPTLSDYLRSEDAHLRSDAACALGDRLRACELDRLDPPVVQRLHDLLQDRSAEVRLEAAIALAELHDSQAIDVLIEALRAKGHRLDATRALGRLGHPQAVQPLADMMGRWWFPWADRLQAAAALCSLGYAPGAEFLRVKLQSRRDAERAAAIHFIGESRHPDAYALLVGILGTVPDPMRDVAARTLGLLGNPMAAAPLKAALVGAQEDFAQDIRQALMALEGTAS